MFKLKSVLLPLATGALALGLAGHLAAQCVVTGDGSGIQCFPLLAGQSIDAGSVCMEVDSGALNVTYTTTDGWELTEAHLWVGQTLDDLPQTKTGNPIPGKFPYNSGDITGLTSFTFSIPLSNPLLNFACPSDPVTFLLAAHAAVRKSNGDGTYQTETGWSDGSPITTKGNWATYSTFTLTCDCGGSQPVTKCETAFAYGGAYSRCFELDGFNRWGWTNGPLTTGTYTFDLYAGAGQCDLTKGTLMGTVTVTYSGSTVTVAYATTNGWWMTESHLYVGSAKYPQFKQGKNMVDTVAPGQYPYIHGELAEVTADTYSVGPFSGSIYVIAHAGVCHYTN